MWDWQKVVNQKLVVYVGLDALSDAAVAGAVGNSMFADLVGYAGERYKHGDGHGHPDGGAGREQDRIAVHMDEFSELMGDEFVPMVNKGGAAGLMVTAYSQTLADIEAKMGSPAVAQQVIGNFNNLIMFRVKGLETARIMSEQLPEVTVTEITQIAGYTDSSDPDSDRTFTSRQEDRVSTSRVADARCPRAHQAAQGRVFCDAARWEVLQAAPAVADAERALRRGGVRSARGGHEAPLRGGGDACRERARGCRRVRACGSGRRSPRAAAGGGGSCRCWRAARRRRW